MLLGFATAQLLYSLSYADVLDEEAGTGYQRRFSERHSLDFRRYIRLPGSTTIPLTFNLTPATSHLWKVDLIGEGQHELVIAAGAERVLAQVDCQHRLGHLEDLLVSLPFMVFVGLTEREEMEVFNIINSKAKGLSSSLLDYHEARLVRDVAAERPELFIALHLNQSEVSPWYRQLDLGGNRTSGLQRRASLRTMQKAVKRFLASTSVLSVESTEAAARIVLDYWMAVAVVLREEWQQPRRHFLTKGVGVYALMGVLSDLWKEAKRIGRSPNSLYFTERLSEFASQFDWSNEGPLKGLGGESGAHEALELLRMVRARTAAELTRAVDGK